MTKLMRSFAAFLIICILVSIVFAQNNNDNSRIEVITVEGRGASENDALKDALIIAIKQVSGAYSMGETLVKDQKIIKDNLYQVTEGVVRSYEEISVRKDEFGGYIKLVKVSVEKSRVLANLAINGTNSNMQDGRKIFSELVSQYDRESGGKNLLTSLLRSYPENILEGSAYGKPHVVENEDDNLVFENQMRIKISIIKYNELCFKLDEVLKRICTNKGFSSFYAQAFSPIDQAKIQGFFGDYNNLPSELGPKTFAWKPSTQVEKWWTRDFDEKKQIVFLLNTKFDPITGYTEWRWYHIPKINFEIHPITMAVKFRGSQGIIQGDSVEIKPCSTGLHLYSRQIPDTKGNRLGIQVFLGPLFFNAPFFQSEYIVRRNLKIKLEQVRLIEQISYEFYHSGRGKNALDSLVQDSKAEPSEYLKSNIGSYSERINAPSSSTNPKTGFRSSSR